MVKPANLAHELQRRRPHIFRLRRRLKVKQRFYISAHGKFRLAKPASAEKCLRFRRPVLHSLVLQKGRRPHRWLNAKVLAAPLAQTMHQLHQFHARCRKAVRNFWRSARGNHSADHPVVLQLPQLRGQHFFADLCESSRQLRKAFRPKRQIPQYRDFPFAAHHRHRCLHRTTLFSFHFADPPVDLERF
jgi:hypothetical protein